MKKVKILKSDREFEVGKILCIGQNYPEHAKEINFDVPKSPVIFFKPTSAIIFNGDKIVIPHISNNVHHEVELLVLIEKDGKNIQRENALSYVAGYGVGLDMTMRDVQLEAKKKGFPWALAKGFDTSAPVSEFVSADNIDNPNTLCIELQVNGAVKQSSSVGEVMFSVEDLISYISKFITLEKGDIIFTGTPAGVAKVNHNDKLDAYLKNKNSEILTTLSVSVL